jgi:hypothetical protein
MIAWPDPTGDDMKTIKGKKTTARRKAKRRIVSLPLGMKKTREVPKSRVHKPAQQKTDVFTPMETGQPDPDRMPGIENPAAAQGGLGPLNQEGEGEAQNDQLAALEEIEPEK